MGAWVFQLCKVCVGRLDWDRGCFCMCFQRLCRAGVQQVTGEVFTGSQTQQELCFLHGNEGREAVLEITWLIPNGSMRRWGGRCGTVSAHEETQCCCAQVLWGLTPRESAN